MPHVCLVCCQSFYTLAWTTLQDGERKINVLAAAGMSDTLMTVPIIMMMGVMMITT